MAAGLAIEPELVAKKTEAELAGEILALSDRVEARFREAFLSAVQHVRDNFQLGLIIDALEAGNVEKALALVGWSTGGKAVLQAEYGSVVLNTAEEVGTAVATQIPSAIPNVEQLGNESLDFIGEVKEVLEYFDTPLPQAVDAEQPLRAEQPRSQNFRYSVTDPDSVKIIAEYTGTRIQDIVEDQLVGVREAMTEGYRRGWSTRDIAKALESTIGLTRRQRLSNLKYRNGLLEQRQEAKAAGEDAMSLDRIDELVQAHADRALQYRTNNIARTESKLVAAISQELSWQQAVNKGFIDLDVAEVMWLTAADENVCPICGPMHGQVVPLRALLSNEPAFIAGTTPVDARALRATFRKFPDASAVEALTMGDVELTHTQVDPFPVRRPTETHPQCRCIRQLLPKGAPKKLIEKPPPFVVPATLLPPKPDVMKMPFDEMTDEERMQAAMRGRFEEGKSPYPMVSAALQVGPAIAMDSFIAGRKLRQFSKDHFDVRWRLRQRHNEYATNLWNEITSRLGEATLLAGDTSGFKTDLQTLFETMKPDWVKTEEGAVGPNTMVSEVIKAFRKGWHDNAGGVKSGALAKAVREVFLSHHEDAELFLENIAEVEQSAEFSALDSVNKVGMHGVVEAVWRNTQKFLREEYSEDRTPKFITVYRGTHAVMEEGLREHNLAPLSAWSLNPSKAARYGSRLLAATVPYERVFDIVGTGGIADNDEVILLGGPLEALVMSSEQAQSIAWQGETQATDLLPTWKPNPNSQGSAYIPAEDEFNEFAGFLRASAQADQIIMEARNVAHNFPAYPDKKWHAVMSGLLINSEFEPAISGEKWYNLDSEFLSNLDVEWKPPPAEVAQFPKDPPRFYFDELPDSEADLTDWVQDYERMHPDWKVAGEPQAAKQELNHLLGIPNLELGAKGFESGDLPSTQQGRWAAARLGFWDRSVEDRLQIRERDKLRQTMLGAASPKSDEEWTQQRTGSFRRIADRLDKAYLRTWEDDFRKSLKRTRRMQAAQEGELPITQTDPKILRARYMRGQLGDLAKLQELLDSAPGRYDDLLEAYEYRIAEYVKTITDPAPPTREVGTDGLIIEDYEKSFDERIEAEYQMNLAFEGALKSISKDLVRTFQDEVDVEGSMTQLAAQKLVGAVQGYRDPEFVTMRGEILAEIANDKGTWKGGDTEWDRNDRAGFIVEDYTDQLWEVVRSFHKETRFRFEEARGLDEKLQGTPHPTITLYASSQGNVLEKIEDSLLEALGIDDEDNADVYLPPLSNWTLDPTVALQKGGDLLAITVPRERVLTSYTTGGWNDWRTDEVTIFGGKQRVFILPREKLINDTGQTKRDTYNTLELILDGSDILSVETDIEPTVGDVREFARWNRAEWDRNYTRREFRFTLQNQIRNKIADRAAMRGYLGYSGRDDRLEEPSFEITTDGIFLAPGNPTVTNMSNDQLRLYVDNDRLLYETRRQWLEENTQSTEDDFISAKRDQIANFVYKNYFKDRDNEKPRIFRTDTERRTMQERYRALRMGRVRNMSGATLANPEAFSKEEREANRQTRILNEYSKKVDSKVADLVSVRDLRGFISESAAERAMASDPTGEALRALKIESVQRWRDRLAGDWGGSSDTGWALSLQLAVDEAFLGDAPNVRHIWTRESVESARARYRKNKRLYDMFVRAQYQVTQEYLRDELGMENPDDPLTVYRGWHQKDENGQPAYDLEAEPAYRVMSMQPVSSVSMDPITSWYFGTHMMTATVPRERIFALPWTGKLGAAREMEMLMLGGDLEAFTGAREKIIPSEYVTRDKDDWLVNKSEHMQTASAAGFHVAREYGVRPDLEIQVGITSHRPGKTEEEAIRHMQAFRDELHSEASRTGAIELINVELGRGGWNGGSEPTWVTRYVGDGVALDKVLDYGKRFDQDAVLLMRRLDKSEQDEDYASPSVRIWFDDALTKDQIVDIEAMLVDANPYWGWTWEKRPDGSTALMLVDVPKWSGGQKTAHIEAVGKVYDMLEEAGLKDRAGYLRSDAPKTATTGELMEGGYLRDAKVGWVEAVPVDTTGVVDEVAVREPGALPSLETMLKPKYQGETVSKASALPSVEGPLDFDDDWQADGAVYHVTSYGALEFIQDAGLEPSAELVDELLSTSPEAKVSLAATPYAAMKWFRKLREDSALAGVSADSLLTKIMLRIESPEDVQPDDKASQQVPGSVFVSDTIPPEKISFWNGYRWAPLIQRGAGYDQAKQKGLSGIFASIN